MNDSAYYFTDGDTTLAEVGAAFADTERVRLKRDVVNIRHGFARSIDRPVADVEGIEPVLYGSDFNSHLEVVVLYDARSDLYAVASAHKRNEAMSLAEYDWKVTSVGPDLSGEITGGDFVDDTAREEWLGWFLTDVVEHGDAAPVAAVRPGEPGFEVELVESGELGMTGDRFTVTLTAGEA